MKLERGNPRGQMHAALGLGAATQCKALHEVLKDRKFCLTRSHG
jgi:hypothetical protein